MERMKTNPNILTEPPSPTTSPTMLKHQSSRYWNENPEASSVDSLYLEEKTKAAIGELYNLIDTNGDGKLTIEDFQKPTSAMSRDAIVKWELLCARPGPTAPHTLTLSVTCSCATAQAHRVRLRQQRHRRPKRVRQRPQAHGAQGASRRHLLRERP